MERRKILAVDDNPVNLAAIEQALQEQYEVVPMVAAPRALKYLTKFPVDLILLDVQMPGMSGVEALQELRGLPNGEHAPVIFLSGTRDEDAAAEGERLGVLDYIVKPFDPDALRQRIGAILEQ